jgi:hypothetical protein
MSRGVVLGLISGIVSSILVFLILGRFLPPVSGVHGFISIDSDLRSATGITGNGLMLALISRMIIGVIVGAIFGAVVVGRRFSSSSGRIVGSGIVAGIIAWVVLSVLGVVVYDTMSGIALSSSTMTSYLIYSFVRYFIFGLIMGALVAFLLPRYRTTVVTQQQPVTVTQSIQRSQNPS